MIYWVPKCAQPCTLLGAQLSGSKAHLSISTSVLCAEPEDRGSRQSYVTHGGHFHSPGLDSSFGK